jgi:hypothetical protein
MFQWVARSLETLQSLKLHKDFEKQLGELPRSLAGLYDTIYKQIMQSEGYGRLVAEETFKWLLRSQTLAYTDLILGAISIGLAVADQDIQDPTILSLDSLYSALHDRFPESFTVKEQDILRCCQNLVVLDRKQDCFRWAHLSVKEYMQRSGGYPVAAQNALLAERCLDVYLIQSGWGSPEDPALKYLYELEYYARRHWYSHLYAIGHEISSILREKATRFLLEGLEPAPGFRCWRQLAGILYHRVLLDDDRETEFHLQIEPLLLICEKGLSSLATIFDRYPRAWLAGAFTGSPTLLETAVIYNHDEVTFALLENLGPDFSNIGIATALAYAAKLGFESSFLMLSSKTPDLRMLNLREHSALTGAISTKSHKIVEVLLEQGLDPNLENEYRHLPLCYQLE